MGSFGYICKGCGSAIRGDAFDGGEKCVLIHVRSGQEIGRVEGHYNEFGSVIEHEKIDENEKFRGNGKANPNSHSEIMKSEFRMKDSYCKLLEFRIYNGNWEIFRTFCRKRFMEELIKRDYNINGFLYHEVVLAKAVVDRDFSNKLNQYNACHKKYVFVDETKEEKELTVRILEDLVEVMFETLIDDFYDLEDEYIRAEWESLAPVVPEGGYSGVVAYHSCCYKKALKEKTFNMVPSKFDPCQSWGRLRKRYLR